MALTMIGRWLKRWACFHHDHYSGTSWIKSQLIDTGMRKMFWCTHCEQTWIY